jgi:hypothetical protein
MPTATIRRELTKLKRLAVGRQAARSGKILNRLKADLARLMTDGGLAPDPWQRDLLRSVTLRVMMLASRQSGKSQVAAALALKAALLAPPALVLLLSPTQRQSAELFQDKVMRLYRDLGRPVAAAQESALRLELANGSRIISLPGKEEGIRGFSGASLLVIDEASRVPDALYYSVRPMLAVSRGQLVCLSTPYGKRGWFFEEWHGSANWRRVKVTAEECPRISAEFLAEERQALGDRWFRQEYLCSFEEVIDAVFSQADIDAALSDDIEPLIVG